MRPRSNQAPDFTHIQGTLMRNLLSSTAAILLTAYYPAAAPAQTEQQPAQNQQPAQAQQPLAPAGGNAAASQQGQQGANGAAAETQQQVAQQCLENLTAFAQRMDQDQFWLSGWGTAWGYGSGTATTGVPPAGVADPAATGATAPAPGVGGPMGADPWAAAGGPLYGVQSPRNQIEVLYGAAYVLAQQGKQDGCEYVLAELTNTYEQYTARLQEAGIDPAEVTSWRQEKIALAQPVQEVQGMSRFTIDDVTGTDVRNLQDEHLGSVSDVILDPKTGAITYAIVARGGFLGIGREHVAVPWNQFRATPGLNTLVLNVAEEAMQNAPTVDPDSFADPTTVTRQNEQVDQYWGQQGG